MTKCSETSSGWKTGVKEGLATTFWARLDLHWKKTTCGGAASQQAPTHPCIIHLPCEHHPPCQMYLLSIISTPVFKRPKWKGPHPQDENVDQDMIIFGKLTEHVKPWMKLKTRCVSGKEIVLVDDRSWCLPKKEDYSNSRVVIQRDGEGWLLLVFIQWIKY